MRAIVGPGTLVARRYRIVDLLGSGGQGSVWRAADTVTGAEVAVKILSGPRGGTSRDRREIAAMRLARMQGVVPLIDEGRQDGATFLVMDLVRGRPFPGALDRASGEPATWGAIAAPTRGLLEILARIHDAGLVHRDLKPSNVLVDERGAVHVLDFGLAVGEPLGVRLGQEPWLIGTPAYIAPELIRGERFGPGTDLYSLGIMLYELLAGERPHRGSSWASIRRARLDKAARSLGKAVPRVPRAIVEVVDRLLERQIHDRPPSARSVLALLRGGARHPTVFQASKLGILRRAKAVGALTSKDLQPLFSGRARIYHVPEDAAIELHRRTGGAPKRVCAEVDAWIREGIAEWEDGRVSVPRAALDRLRAGLDPIGAHEPEHAIPTDLPADLSRLVSWLGVARRVTDIDAFARAMKQPRPLVERAIDQLVEREIVRTTEDGALALNVSFTTDDFDGPRPHDVHRLLAGELARGAPDRLRHILACTGQQWFRACDIGEEALVAARRRAEEGRLGIAAQLLSGAIDVVRALGPSEDEPRYAYPRETVEERLLASWLEVAVAGRLSRELDRVQYELSRAIARGPRIDQMTRLGEGALALDTDAPRALDLLQATGTLDHAGLELRRLHLMMIAARSRPASVETIIFANAKEQLVCRGDAAAKARVRGWEGRLYYRDNRFEQAAAAFAESAEHEPWTSDRAMMWTNAASALVEAGRYAEALDAASRAQVAAAAGRVAFVEARAEWVRRAALFRMDGAGAADLDLVDALEGLGAPDLEALVCLTEAAVAFRQGAIDVTRTLAGRAVQLWARTAVQPDAAILTRALGVAAGAVATDEQIEELAERAGQCRIAGMGLQALALLAQARPLLRPKWQAWIPLLLATVPEGRREDRLDVLSAREAMTCLAHGRADLMNVSGSNYDIQRRSDP